MLGINSISRPYGMLIDPERKSHLYHYDEKVLQDMLNEFKNIENRSSACSMDICVTEDGRIKPQVYRFSSLPVLIYIHRRIQQLYSLQNISMIG